MIITMVMTPLMAMMTTVVIIYDDNHDGNDAVDGNVDDSAEDI